MGDKLKILNLEEKVQEAIENGEHLNLIDMACILIYGEPSNDQTKDYFLDKYSERKKECSCQEECQRYALSETLKYLERDN